MLDQAFAAVAGLEIHAAAQRLTEIAMRFEQAKAHAALVAAVAAGELTPAEASDLAKLVESFLLDELPRTRTSFGSWFNFPATTSAKGHLT